MSIFKMVLGLFIFYFIYKLIVDFIVPIYVTAKQMKQKMRAEVNNNKPQYTTKKSTFTKKKKEDYIDFEEVTYPSPSFDKLRRRG